MEVCARNGWRYRVIETRIKCIKMWKLIKHFQENAYGQAVPRGRTWVEWELCTVQYCIFISLLLSTVSLSWVQLLYLVVQKQRLGKIMYKSMWFSHCTKTIPLFTSELIRVIEKRGNRIGCTKNIRGGFWFWRGLW